MLTLDQQLNNLNILVKIKLAPSKIHGVGVFALRDIPLNAKLYPDRVPELYHLSRFDLKKLYPEIRELLLDKWPQTIYGERFIYPTERMLNYFNHSDKPNYDLEKDETLTDIYEEEEVLIDYRKIKNWKKVFPWLN